MAIDGLNQLSTDQLMAMSMMGNGQVTNDSSSTNSTSDETNLAFQLMLQNLMNSQKKTKENETDLAKVQTTVAAVSTNSNSNLSADATNNTGSKEGYSDIINVKNNVAKVIQQCPTGKNLEDLPMILTNSYVNPDINTSKSTISNRSDVDMQKIRAAVSSASKKYGVDENLILAIIKQESDFNSNDTSSCGAAGLMQIMPENFSNTGITDAYDVNQNVNGGTKLFKEYLNQYNGDVEMALMAYNGGPGTMQKRGVSSSSDLYKMPKETQNYVPKVMGYYRNGV